MKTLSQLLAVLLFAGWSGIASAGFIDVDLSGWETVGGYFNSSNTSMSIALAPGTKIVGAEYIGLEYESFGASWNSELVLSLNDGASAFPISFWDTQIAGATGIPGVFGPASADFANPGYLTSGPFNLSTGDLYIEVYETFNDAGAGIDARISAGTLRIETTVPTPSVLALFGIGLAGLGWSTRKKA